MQRIKKNYLISKERSFRWYFIKKNIFSYLYNVIYKPIDKLFSIPGTFHSKLSHTHALNPIFHLIANSVSTLNSLSRFNLVNAIRS